MNVLHIDCSPREGSQSRQLSAAIVGRIIGHDPSVTIKRRDLALDPVPHASAAYSAGLFSAETLMAAEPDAFSVSEQLIQEVETSDVVVIGTPMHNYTVPSVLKAWLDQLLRVGRTIAPSPTGKVGLIPDRPVFVAISSGGVFAGDRANQPDFLTPYLKVAFETVGVTSVRFFLVQATAFRDDAALAAERATQVALFDPSMLSRLA